MAFIPLLVRNFALVAAGTLFCSAAAVAADPGLSADARTRYRQELADCNSGKSQQNIATCRLEARNAYNQALRGGFNEDASQYQSNALRRCDVHKGQDRRACEMRINGQGNVEGSVRDGGLLRQSSIVVPGE